MRRSGRCCRVWTSGGDGWCGGADQGAIAPGASHRARLGGRPAQGGGLLLAGSLAHTRAARHPHRDAQFRYINDQAGEFIQAGQPVISAGSALLSGMPPVPLLHSTTTFPPVRSP
ncbi:hypothetical protein GTW41_27875 [Streptomyces sp. SID4941]|nr:hypothetical protein [Streptomyces sp. SID4941]